MNYFRLKSGPRLMIPVSPGPAVVRSPIQASNDADHIKTRLSNDMFILRIQTGIPMKTHETIPSSLDRFSSLLKENVSSRAKSAGLAVAAILAALGGVVLLVISGVMYLHTELHWSLALSFLAGAGVFLLLAVGAVMIVLAQIDAQKRKMRELAAAGKEVTVTVKETVTETVKERVSDVKEKVADVKEKVLEPLSVVHQIRNAPFASMAVLTGIGALAGRYVGQQQHAEHGQGLSEQAHDLKDKIKSYASRYAESGKQSLQSGIQNPNVKTFITDILMGTAIQWLKKYMEDEHERRPEPGVMTKAGRTESVRQYDA